MKYEGLSEYAREHTLKECAEKYNVSYSAVQAYLFRHNISHKEDKNWAKDNNPKYKHGCTNTRLFHIWQHMKARCNYPANKSYRNYGGRGIIVCTEWNDFLPFQEWALNNGYSDSLTIDRIDNSKGYCPENCRWVNYYVQNNNRRYNHLIEYKGEIKTLAQWAVTTGLPATTLYNRLEVLGWSVERALKTKTKKFRRSLDRLLGK